MVASRLARTVLRNAVWVAAAQITVKLLSFVFSVLVVRGLGPETYGQYAAVMAFGALFVVFSDLGLSPYAVRQVARQRSEANANVAIARLYGNVLSLRVLLALMTALAIVAAGWLTGRPVVMVSALAMSSVGLLIYAFQGSSEAILGGYERLDVPSSARVASQLTFVALGILVLWQGMGYFGLILASLIATAILAIICWRAAERLGLRPASPQPRAWLPMLRDSFPFALIGLTLGFSYKFDSVLLNISRGDTETGYYSAAYNLVFAAVLLSNALNTSLYPSLVRAAKDGGTSLLPVYARILKYLLVLSLPITVGGCVLAEEISLFLFTDSYAPTALALGILVWAIPLMFLSESLGYILVVDGKEGKVARALMLSTSLNVALNLILVPVFGFAAAAAMTVATEGVLVAQYAWILRRVLEGAASARSVIGPVVAALLMGAAVVLARPLPLLASVALGVGVYVPLLLALGVIGREELAFLRSIHLAPEHSGVRGS